MKLKLFAIALLIGHFSFAQSSADNSVNNKNYYDHFQDIEGYSLNWLRTSDAVPIIIDELLKNGIAYHTIGVGELIKLNDTTRFVMTVSFNKDGKEYGFIYEATHSFPLNRKDRDFLTEKEKAYYVQVEMGIIKGVNLMRIDPLPNNVFLLNQTCYWFQDDENGTKYKVTKEVAQNILRQDIDDYVNNL